MPSRLFDALLRLDERFGVAPKAPPPHPPDEPLTRFTDALRAFGVGLIALGTAAVITGLLFSDAPIRRQLLFALGSGLGVGILGVFGAHIGFKGALNWSRHVDPLVPLFPGSRALVQLSPLFMVLAVSAVSLAAGGDWGVWAGGIVVGLVTLIRIRSARKMEERLQAEVLVRLRWFGPAAYYLRPYGPTQSR